MNVGRDAANVSKETLKERVKAELESNETFRRGYRLSAVLGGIYFALRLVNPFVAWLWFGVELSFSSSELMGLMFCLCVFFGALEGSNKLAGGLCILSAAATAGTFFSSAMEGGGSFEKLFNFAATWYISGYCVVFLILGLAFLLSRDIRDFGARRRELAKANYTATIAHMDELDPVGAEKRQKKAAKAQKNLTRNVVILVLCLTAAATAAVFYFVQDGKAPDYDSLRHGGGALESFSQTETEGNYRLTVAGDSKSYSISSIYDFPAQYFIDNVRVGDSVTLRYSDDEYYSIMELVVNGVSYLSYEDACAALNSNSLWGVGIVGVPYLVITALILADYFRRKKKADEAGLGLYL